jgi:hypothetical protein
MYQYQQRMNKDNIQEIFEQAQTDPSLRNTLCVEDLLEKIGAENRPHFAVKTINEITEDVVKSFTELDVYSPDFIDKCCRSLFEYQHIDEIHKFQHGRVLRWLRINPIEPDENKAKLNSGALCTGVKFFSNGTYVQCIAVHSQRFFTLKFDDYLFYQKLSPEEQMILSLNTHLQQDETFSSEYG